MWPPEELDAVDWSALEHAYGPAGEVLVWIRALYAEQDPEADSGELVLDELVQSIHHQGSVYSATVAAVPFLAHCDSALHCHDTQQTASMDRDCGTTVGLTCALRMPGLCPRYVEPS